MVTELRSADARQLIEQHRAMEREADEWRQWWRELDEWGDPRFEEMGVRLAKFHNDLEEHFKLEEACGYFDCMAERRPDRRSEVDRIRSQHRELLAGLKQLVEALTPSEVNYETWGGARADFEAFLDALHAHEAAERDLGGGLASDAADDRERSH